MKKILNFFKWIFFFVIFIGLIISIGILIISFREDDIICYRLINYLAEFYYKKVSWSNNLNILYMGECSEINDIVTNDPRLYYTRGPEDNVKGTQPQTTRSGEITTDQVVNSRSINTRVSRPLLPRPVETRVNQVVDPRLEDTRSLLPRTENRNFNAEGEELIRTRKESLKLLKAYIRITNLTILTEKPNDLNNFKIVTVPNKIFYIKRDVFYNGDREKVKLVIDKLRDFHMKGSIFSSIEFKMEERKGRALSFKNMDMDKDLRWFLQSMNPYNPNFVLPNTYSFYQGHFESSRSPTPSPILSNSATIPYNPIKDRMSILNILNLSALEEQENLIRQEQEKLIAQKLKEELEKLNRLKLKQREEQVVNNSNENNEQMEIEGQITDNSSDSSDEDLYEWTRINKLMMEEEKNKRENRRILRDSLIEQKK
jgi:hypothetical protein